MVWLLCGLFNPAMVSAEQPIQVRANEHTFVFGQQVRFHLEVAGKDPIQSIILAYRTSEAQETTVQRLSFKPNTLVSVDHIHRVASRYIRPFVEVTYWWTIVNVAEARLTTEPQIFVYTDNRFKWKALNDGAVGVHWYQGDVEIAQKALDVLVSGMARARQDIHIDTISQPIDAYLYSSADDLRVALPAEAPLDTEALTLYETSVILVALGPEKDNIADLKRILPHEVTHALIHEATRSEFDHVPLWLSEGLATSVQYTFMPDPDAQALVEEGVRDHRLIPLDTLCGAFPHDLVRARLAYAESASVINHVRDLYGRQALRDLVAAYGDGATCEGGVRRVLGVSLDRLEAEWSAKLVPRKAWVAFWEDNGAWVLLFVLFAMLPLAFVVPSPARTAGSRNRGS